MDAFPSRGARRRMACVIALAGWCACRTAIPPSKDPEPRVETTPSASEDRPEPDSAAAPLRLTPNDPLPCGSDGRLWEGPHEGCFYEHKGCCYPSPETACLAAGCPLVQCQVIEARPAQVVCRSDAA